jgi:hypothetical protein
MHEDIEMFAKTEVFSRHRQVRIVAGPEFTQFAHAFKFTVPCADVCSVGRVVKGDRGQP